MLQVKTCCSKEKAKESSITFIVFHYYDIFSSIMCSRIAIKVIFEDDDEALSLVSVADASGL